MRPKLQQLVKQITERGGDEYVFDFIREGRPIEGIMREEFDLSSSMFYRWVHMTSERELSWERAKVDSGHIYAEKALAALTDERLGVAPTSAEVNLANSRARAYQWRASKVNRAAYGDDALVSIHNEITTGSAHLDALLKHGLGQALEAATNGREIQEAEFTLIEGDVAATTEFDDLEDTWEE